jgi:hypothetical protein
MSDSKTSIAADAPMARTKANAAPVPIRVPANLHQSAFMERFEKKVERFFTLLDSKNAGEITLSEARKQLHLIMPQHSDMKSV